MAKEVVDTEEPIEEVHNKDLNIHQRMIEIMKSLSYVKKEGKNKFQGYAFAKHDDVTRSVRELCIAHGVLPVPTEISHECQTITQKNGD